jgi:alkylation response protein AidB-like acyl-CoA dehydrogenase
MWPKTKNQQKIIDVSKRIATQIKSTASAFDTKGTFPHSHFDLIRDTGYLTAAVPTAYGGWGSSLLELMLGQYELGKVDGSTAVSVGMHHQTVGTEASESKWPVSARSQIFNDIVNEGALINNVASEPELGSPRGGGTFATVLSPGDNGDWILNGRKNWSTLSPQLTYALTYASLENGTNQIVKIAQKMNAHGVSIDETWNSMAMRSTGSHDIVFDNVRVCDEDILIKIDPSLPSASLNEGDAWFPLLLSAANLGIARAASSYAIDFAINRKPTGSQSSISQIPFVRQQIAEMESILMMAYRTLFSCGEDWDNYPDHRADLLIEIGIVKIKTIDASIAVTDKAMRIVGGVALEKNRPLERYFRDVRSAVSNPPIEARALNQLAVLLLD